MRDNIKYIISLMSKIDKDKVEFSQNIDETRYVFPLGYSGTELVFEFNNYRFDSIYVQLNISNDEEVALSNKEQRHLKVALMDFIDREWEEKKQEDKRKKDHLYSLLNMDMECT